MATNTRKTKYIIFCEKYKINLVNIFDNANDPNYIPNPDLITSLEWYHNNHKNKNCRRYELLGIYLNEFVFLYYDIGNIYNKINRTLYCIKQAIKNISLLP
jgi:hypothetical protein